MDLVAQARGEPMLAGFRPHQMDVARQAILTWVANTGTGPTQVEVDLAIACSIGDQNCTRDAIDAITAARAAVRDLYAGR